jgi:hypothetical protein
VAPSFHSIREAAERRYVPLPTMLPHELRTAN